MLLLNFSLPLGCKILQVEENKYEAELRERNVSNILKLAIVFKGKKIEVVEGTSEM